MGSIDKTARAFVSSSLFKRPATHRTNSLGWAKSDCHICQSASCLCDRRRPRCDACTARGLICNGYVQTLQWQDHGQKTRSERVKKTALGDLGKKGPKGAEDSSVSSSGRNGDFAKTRNYSFIQENGRQTERTKICTTSRPVLQEAKRKVTWLSLGVESTPGRARSEAKMDVIPPLYRFQPQCFQLPVSTLEQITFFIWRFSTVTLTYDIKANPWQACLPQIDHPPSLLYAVRALAIRHRSHLEETPEILSVLELKDKALSSFAQSIGTMSLKVDIFMSLLLIGIDFAESALENWIIHLQGVYRMIEASGGIRFGDNDVYIRVQIAQIVWYDAITALLSRRGPVFPREYVECVVLWKSESQWSLLALNGFPYSAFLDMCDIARAAANAPSLPNGYATSLEMKLWIARFETGLGTTDNEISALTDCWRLGLLLYCTRVFHQGEIVKAKSHLLAEEIMWLVHELPPDSDKQKQAVFPLFLAACEFESFRFRCIAMDFCERWRKKSGLWLNQTVVKLLQTVWTAVDEDPERDIWWGEFVDPLSEFGYLFG